MYFFAMNVYKQNNEHKVTTLYMLISNFQFIPTDIVSYEIRY